VRLAQRLPRFLRNTLSIEEARSTVRRRVAQRTEHFLSLVRDVFLARPENPYYRLLGSIGCTYGDVQRLIETKGLESALLALHQAGVCLSVEEFKGRRPVVRGSLSFQVNPAHLLNPNAVVVAPRASSGSRGARTLIPLDLDSIRDQALDICVTFDSHGGADWSFAVWDVPGGAAIDKVLSTSAFGNRPVRWFSQVDPASEGLHPRYRWSTRFLCLVSAAAGRPLPAPRYVPLDRPEPILAWVHEVLARGRTPCIRTYASSAMRLAEAAQARGISLRGVQFSLGGEPITGPRLAAIRAAGASAHPSYGVMETGPLGFGCAQPFAPDDVHLFADRLALIQPTGQGASPGQPDGALYVTSLLPSARVVLLNAALGDRAIVEQRPCGCRMAEVGWTTHVHSIRSYQKVTVGGMTFLDSELIRVLEEVLPARFGGSPADYQLLEDLDADGAPRLRLLVHPRLGPVDEAAVANTFLEAIGDGSGVEQVMELAWRKGGWLQVRREAPRSGETGKVLHFHQERAPLERTLVAAGRR
jgi:hypothetical protein